MFFSLTYGEAEAILSAMHVIVDEKRIAFRSRLRHFQRLGFPPGLNTGKGRRAEYDAGHLMLLVLALELTQLGLSPERAVRVLQANRRMVARVVLMALYRRAASEAVYFVLDPIALQDLMDARLSSFDERSFGHALHSELMKHLTDLQFNLTRMAIINVTSLLIETIRYLEMDLDGETLVMQFVEGIKHWARKEEEVNGDDQKA